MGPIVFSAKFKFVYFDAAPAAIFGTKTDRAASKFVPEAGAATDDVAPQYWRYTSTSSTYTKIYKTKTNKFWLHCLKFATKNALKK
jgi:hypothetical protein